MTNRPLARAAVFLVIQAATTLSAQTRGTITAQVTDQGGNLVAGARVAMVPADARGGMGVLRECLTDNNGVCSQDLGFGKYHVVAQKKSDAYPDCLANFYGHGKWPTTAEIALDVPTANVTVRLGPKAGLLVIHAADDVSGDPIRQATVTLHPAADPRDIFSTSLQGPDLAVLIPPDEDVLVTVSANGYQPWQLKDHIDLSPGGVVRLHSEDKVEMTVCLKHE
jgi:hypothetical protein